MRTKGVKKNRTIKILQWATGVVVAFALGYVALLIYASRALQNANARITQAGLVVLSHKEENGAYPDDLSELEKGEWIDSFTGKPLVYKTSSSGFVVYSLGENQVDDNGTEVDPEKEDKGDLVWRYAE